MKLTKGFFGPGHMEALIKVLSPIETPLILSEVFSHMEQKVKFSVSSYVTAVMDALPPIKLPSLQLGVIGAYGYFELKLKYIANYGPLKAEVFQSLREVGNVLAFTHVLETINDSVNSVRFVTNAFFLGCRPFITPLDQVTDENAPLLEVFPEHHSPFVNIIRKACRTPGALESRGPVHADPSSLKFLEETANKIEDLMAVPPVRTSYLTTALSRLSMAIAESVLVEWLGFDSDNGVFDHENARDIARLWSAFQFIFCMGTNSNIPALGGQAAANMSLFGEGFCWAGCAFLHVLGLKERFEVMDFTYFVMSLNSVIPYVAPAADSNKKITKSPEQNLKVFLDYFLEEGENVRRINETVFSLFDSHFPSPPHPFVNFIPPLSKRTALSTSIASQGNWEQSGMTSPVPPPPPM